MTAVLAEPRAPQIAEAAAVLRSAFLAPDNSDLRAWYSGVTVGWLVAADIVTDDELTIAKATFFARCVPFDAVQPPTEDAERRRVIFRASGVLFGFREATGERMDAVECSACDCRILLEESRDWTECTNHGWLCDEACAGNVCHAGCDVAR